jgi:hypothetical protein
MKMTIVVCLLLSAAFAQENPQFVQTESHVPWLTLSFAGQQESFYQFKIANTSSHAVTAFALSTVPIGIDKGQGGFVCDNRCSGIFALGDMARPEIKASASLTQPFAISKVNGGTVVLNAAVFDDQSYAGEETAAAQLVARQIGRQAEYDRIVNAVNFILSTNKNSSDVSKTALIRMKLGGLSSSLDPKMVQTFKLWFPELAGCAQQYAGFMKSAAASEKQQVLDSMDQFAHGNIPGNPSLTQWWQTTQEALASAGCSGCGDVAMNPKRHNLEQNVSVKCQAVPVVFTASLADVGTGNGEEEEAAEVDLGPEDVALLDEGAPTEAGVAESAAEAAEPEVAKAEPPAIPVFRVPKRNMPPPGIPFTPAPDGRGQLLLRMRLPADADDLIYRTFFRDIVTLGDMAFLEEVRWIDGEQVEDNGPRAGGLSKIEISILKKAAYECNEQADELKAKSNDLLKSSVSGYPVGWLLYAPPVPGMRELKDQETAAINKCIARLHGNLGSSFVHLQGFVKKVYGTSPAEIRSARLSDDALYSNYLRYLATLNDLAEVNPRAKKEAALRQQELTKAGLEERDRTLVTQTALEFNKALAALYKIPKGEIAISDRRPFGAISAPAPALQVQTGSVPAPTMAAVQIPIAAISSTTAPMPGLRVSADTPTPTVLGLEAQAPDMPAATMPSGHDIPVGMSAAATPESQEKIKEFRRKADEAKLNLLTGIAQLQAGMSAPVHKKFDDYLHELYSDEMIRRVADFRSQAASTPVSKPEQQ